MKYVKITAAFVVSAFLLFSVVGVVFYKPGKSIFLVNPCYKGVQPALAFGGSRSFSYNYISFGPKYFQVRTRMLSWPGGVLALTLVNRNLCPDATEKEMDKDTRKDMIKRPELYNDED